MKLLLSITLLIVSSLPVLAQQKTPPPPGPARPLNLPKLTEKKLSNGLTVVLAPLPNVPKVSAILTFRAATDATDRTAHPGIAQIAAGIANEGTDTRTSKQIKEELRSIGGSLNLFTDADQTQLTATSLSEFSNRMFDLMSDVAQHPAFPETEVKLAQENTIQQIRAGRSNPGFLANERFQKAVFGNHPYSFVVPDEKSISALTRDDLKAFVTKYYMPNAAHLIVVGDIDVEKTYAEIEKAFSSWKSGTVPPDENPPVPSREKRQIYFVNRPGSVQSAIYIGNVSIPRKNKDYFAIRTTNMIYGGSFYSRLTRNIRESKGYTYSPFSSADLRRAAGAFTAGASVRNEVTGPTLLEMLYELDRMRVAPVTDEELQSAKTYSIGGMELELESQASLTGRISSIYIDELSHDFLQTFRDKVAALTPAEVQRAAAKYFDTYRSAIVIVGDYKQIKDQIAPFGDVKLIK